MPLAFDGPRRCLWFSASSTRWCQLTPRQFTRAKARNILEVVIPVLTQHYAMLQRNLLYTGVTRGKKLVVLVGQKKGRHRRAQRIGASAVVETERMVGSAVKEAK